MAGIENFGMIVLEARRKAGMTQEAFAGKLGITPQAVSKWENGLGYPDVTLFPEIAEVLDIPIERLFGVETDSSRIVPFPPKKDGLDYIFSHKNRACYSSKTLEKIDTEKHIAYFTDGSIADCENRSVTNLGTGEIRFFDAEAPDEVYDSGKTAFCREFGDFSSITANLSAIGSLTVKRVESGRGRIEAYGSSRFITRIESELSGDTLHLSFSKTDRDDQSRSRKNEIVIYVPSERISVCKLTVSGTHKVKIEPDCGILDVSISGCGDITAANCNIMECKINGCGSVDIGTVAFSTNISINGSGEVKAASLCSPSMKISGSGTVEAREIKGGEMSVSVSGSGNIECGGEIDMLKLKMNGSGRLECANLTVGEANITTSGSSEITIGRIKRASYEKLSKNTVLSVLARGED